MTSASEDMFLESLQPSFEIRNTEDKQMHNLVARMAHDLKNWVDTDMKSWFPTPYTTQLYQRPDDHFRKLPRTRLLYTLENMMTLLIRERNYSDAARILELVYCRFRNYPALCVQSSLELMRRTFYKAEDHQTHVKEFYREAMHSFKLDKLVLCKEMFMALLADGEYYQSYHFFIKKILPLLTLRGSKDLEDIVRFPELLGYFGIICYWLLFVESPQLRNEMKKLHGDDLSRDNIKITEPSLESLETKNSFASFEGMMDRNMLSNAAIGVESLYQDACLALRRVITLLPHSSCFLEYYVQLLTMNSEVSTAANFLENFYQMYPNDVQALRMLVNYLRTYYPKSSITDVKKLLFRWLTLDPTSISAYRTLKDFLQSLEDEDSSDQNWAQTLAGILDVCGSEVYYKQCSQHAEDLWSHFAKTITALANGSDDSRSILQKLASDRFWWQDTFFGGIEREMRGHEASFFRWAAHKAVVSVHLFESERHTDFVRDLRRWMECDDNISSAGHSIIRCIFESFELDALLQWPSTQSSTNSNTLEDPRQIMQFKVLNRNDILLAHPGPNLIHQSTGKHSSGNEYGPMSAKRQRIEVSSCLPRYIPLIDNMYNGASIAQNHTLKHFYTSVRRKLQDVAASNRNKCAKHIFHIPSMHEVDAIINFCASRRNLVTTLPLECDFVITRFLRKHWNFVSHIKRYNLSPLLYLIHQKIFMRRSTAAPYVDVFTLKDFVRRKFFRLKRYRRRILRAFMAVVLRVIRSERTKGRVINTDLISSAAVSVTLLQQNQDIITESDIQSTVKRCMRIVYPPPVPRTSRRIHSKAGHVET